MDIFCFKDRKGYPGLATRDAFRIFSCRGFLISATIFSKKLNSKEVGYV